MKKKQTYAEVLNAIRTEKGLTQEALAKATGIPVTSVRNHLQGRREFSAVDMWAYVKALDVEPCVFKEATPSLSDSRKKRAK